MRSRAVDPVVDVLAAVGDVVIRYDPDGTVAWASPSLMPVLGYDPDQVVGSALRVTDPADLPQARRVLHEARREHREQVQVRSRVVRADGARLWADTLTRLVWSEDGVLEGYVAVLRDVTGQVEAGQVETGPAQTGMQRNRQEALRASALMGMLDPFALLAPLRDAAGAVVDLRFVEVNNAAVTYLLREFGEVVGRSLREVVSAGAADAIVGVCAPVADGGGPVTMADYALASERWSGATRMFDLRAWPLEGGLVGFTWRDVSERHAATAALKASEEQYRLLSENAADILLRLDGQDRVVWASPSLQRLTGWAPEAWVGDTRRDLIHPDDLPAVMQGVRALRSGAEASHTVRVRVRHRHGPYSWWSATAQRTTDDPGSDVVVALRDVDAQVRAQASARRQEALRAAALDAMLDPFALLEPVLDATGTVTDLRFVEANRAAHACARAAAGTLPGRRLAEAMTPQTAATLTAAFARVLEPGQPFVLDGQPLAAQVAGGATRMFDLRASAVEGCVEVAWRDVTERVQAAAALAESEARYRLLAERGTDVVFRGSAEGVLEWVSPSVPKVLGHAPEDMVGQPITGFVHPDDLERMRAAIQDANSGEAVSYRARLRHGDGSWRWMDIAAQPVRGADGTVAARIGSARDVTAQVQAEEALAASEALFRSSMTSASIGVCLIGPDGSFLRVNPALCDLLGRDEDTLLAASWQELTHPDDLAADLCLVDDVLAGRRDSYRLRKRYLRPDGSVVHGDLSVGCVRDPDGAVRHFISQIVDVTEQEQQRKALAAQRASLQATLDSQLDPHLTLTAVRDRAGRIVDFAYGDPNAAALDYLGMTAEQVRATTLMSMYPSRAAEVLRDLFARTVDTGEPLVADEYLYPNGSFAGAERRFDLRGVRLGDAINVSWRDVTDRQAAAAALAESEQRFRTAMLSAPAGMAVVGLDRVFVEVNPALCRILGRPAEELVGRSIVDLLDDLDAGIDRTMRVQARTSPERAVTREHQMIRSDGERVWVEHAVAVLRGPGGEPVSYVSQFVDVTEGRQARERLRFLASHDALTELLNRRELIHRIEGLLARRPRTGANVAVLFCDLDNLKPINDAHGHAAGDAVITTVAQRLRSTVRADDVVARFGGDEFVVVLTSIHTVDDAARIAAKIHDEVALPVPTAAGEIPVTVSIGLALVQPGDDPETALHRADTALLEAKRRGRNQTVVHPPQTPGPESP